MALDHIFITPRNDIPVPAKGRGTRRSRRIEGKDQHDFQYDTCAHPLKGEKSRKSLITPEALWPLANLSVIPFWAS